jgi:two-component system, LuxR family, sensor kinase FixL
MGRRPAPFASRVIFDSAIGIGFGREISDIPKINGMRKNSTSQKLAATESAVRDREERLRAILETAVEGIITIDERGTIESFNPASEKIFGYNAGEVIGKNVRVLMSTPHREQHDGYIENYKHTGHAKIIGIGRETIARKKDGTLFPIDLSVSEVNLSDRRIFTGFIRDITERKRLEKEILEISEREQRRIGQDLHDGLCQHLAGIEMLSQVLAQKLAPKSKEASARATEIAKAIRESISQTRLLARGLSPVTLESEGLMSALAELALNTEKMFRVRCHFDCPEAVKFENHAAATHLFRIAQEAVSNAIKHGKARNLSIQLRDEAGRIHLRVNDDGIGFPGKNSVSGGMGLRIMQSRIGMVGGALTIERLLPGGTAVIFSAPK